MAIDGRLGKALEAFSKEIEPEPLPAQMISIAAGEIPFVGGALGRLLDGGARRRVAERAKDVFDAMKEQFKNIEESRVNKEFVESEEFMTLVVLALQQLQTTHDKQKIQMLANALVNSGTKDFSEENHKELFIRIFRDLAPEHIRALRNLRRQSPTGHLMANDRRGPTGKDLAIFQNLAIFMRDSVHRFFTILETAFPEKSASPIP